ncbi:MAG: hypothetical protein U0984_02745 [Prosthecobacter sp.]|nr:hypothetical protein [Prosthecobacter sp.]
MSRPPYISTRLTLAGLPLLALGISAAPAMGQVGYAASHYAAQRAVYQDPAYPEYLRQQQAYAAYQQQMAAYQAQQQQQMAVYPAYYQQMPAAVPVARVEVGALVRFDGRYAAASTNLPIQVQYAVNAANYLQKKPYVFGGGHRSVEDSAYDCSSAVSYALIKGGLLRGPLTSAAFANYGAPGPGRFITIWVKPGSHVFMTVCGLRLDTTGGREREGPRWRAEGRSVAGFAPRHPVGL